RGAGSWPPERVAAVKDADGRAVLMDAGEVLGREGPRRTEQAHCLDAPAHPFADHFRNPLLPLTEGRIQPHVARPLVVQPVLADREEPPRLHDPVGYRMGSRVEVDHTEDLASRLDDHRGGVEIVRRHLAWWQIQRPTLLLCEQSVW